MWEEGDPAASIDCLVCLSGLAAEMGRFEPAAKLIGATDRLRESLGMALNPDDDEMTGRSEVHARLGADRTAEILAAGRRLSPSETVDFARALAAELLSSADSSPAPTALHGLTPREAEVLRLIAAGHSNRQIGEALFISPRTAQTSANEPCHSKQLLPRRARSRPTLWRME